MTENPSLLLSPSLSPSLTNAVIRTLKKMVKKNVTETTVQDELYTLRCSVLAPANVRDCMIAMCSIFSL